MLETQNVKITDSVLDGQKLLAIATTSREASLYEYVENLLFMDKAANREAYVQTIKEHAGDIADKFIEIMEAVDSMESEG